MSTPETSYLQYNPYIRLTKNADGVYNLWIVTFIPSNFTIPNEPTIDSSNPDIIQVNVNVESGGEEPSGDWVANSLKVTVPAPTVSGESLNVTVLLDDPVNEGSTVIKYEEAEPDV